MRRVLVALLLVAVVAACGGDDEPNATGQPAGTLRVGAASSLVEPFTALGEAFEAEHPGVEVTFEFAGSSAIAQQVSEGAPFDVVATADEATMARLVDAGDVGDPTVFARNRLVLLVGRGNPKGITGLADLADPGVVFVLCAPEVPCGRLGAAALGRAGVEADPSSLEENVKAVFSRVVLGEADAGIVYASDVAAAGDKAEAVPIDGADDPALQAVYPMATLQESGNGTTARAWIDFVTGRRGQAVLDRFGFLPP